ncbi:hypothetical protein M0R19_03110 [Candidatus Pacearchaeota archaeon]|nr:hypothetical protein [Candidatus Pacearchaeota archaeon]
MYEYKHNPFTSISKQLRKENKSNEEFEFMLSRLSLEEVVLLKLELASVFAKGSLYGMSLYKNLKRLLRIIIVRHSENFCKTAADVSSFLGITRGSAISLLKKYSKSPEYFFNKMVNNPDKE